jgi:hypothetical protein
MAVALTQHETLSTPHRRARTGLRAAFTRRDAYGTTLALSLVAARTNAERTHYRMLLRDLTLTLRIL